MHCPKCGQQQISEETRFCSRCGLLLTGIASVVANEGELPGVTGSGPSARARGLKQGLFIFLLFFLLVPMAGLISMVLNVEPVAAGIMAILTIFGGILRMVYALMFESGKPGSPTGEQKLFGGVKSKPTADKRPRELTATPAPTLTYTVPKQGAWIDTNDLAAPPGSVTDNTTKLLENEPEN